MPTRPTPPSIGGSSGGSSSRPSSSSYSRPTPPSVSSPRISTDSYRPSPASRPTPPAVKPSNRPTPPAVDPYYTRPTPPPVYRPIDAFVPLIPRYYPYKLPNNYSSQYANYVRLPQSSNPADIQYNFLNARQRLRDIYNNTPMTRSEYSAIERHLVSQAVDQLMVDARYHSNYDREAALRSIYENSEMTPSEFNRIRSDLRYQ